jgi:RimJ/RimL family protein N-acetyltransferase
LGVTATRLTTRRLILAPIAVEDATALSALLAVPEVRRVLSEDVALPRAAARALIAQGCDAASGTSLWRIATGEAAFAGVIGLRPPSTGSLALRAIGWRSRELIVALDPRVWGQGLAQEAVGAMLEHAAGDGVTFALVTSVGTPDIRAQRLMQRCGFHVLGRAPGPAHEVVVYERAV